MSAVGSDVGMARVWAVVLALLLVEGWAHAKAHELGVGWGAEWGDLWGDERVAVWGVK